MQKKKEKLDYTNHPTKYPEINKTWWKIEHAKRQRAKEVWLKTIPTFFTACYLLYLAWDYIKDVPGLMTFNVRIVP